MRLTNTSSATHHRLNGFEWGPRTHLRLLRLEEIASRSFLSVRSAMEPCARLDSNGPRTQFLRRANLVNPIASARRRVNGLVVEPSDGDWQTLCMGLQRSSASMHSIQGEDVHDSRKDPRSRSNLDTSSYPSHGIGRPSSNHEQAHARHGGTSHASPSWSTCADGRRASTAHASVVATSREETLQTVWSRRPGVKLRV